MPPKSPRLKRDRARATRHVWVIIISLTLAVIAGLLLASAGLRALERLLLTPVAYAKIYISDGGGAKNDGLSLQTAIID